MKKRRCNRAKALIKEAARIRDRVEKEMKVRATADELGALSVQKVGEGPPNRRGPHPKAVREGLDALMGLACKRLAADETRRKHGRGGRVDVVYEEDNVPLHQDERW